MFKLNKSKVESKMVDCEITLSTLQELLRQRGLRVHRPRLVDIKAGLINCPAPVLDRICEILGCQRADITLK